AARSSRKLRMVHRHQRRRSHGDLRLHQPWRAVPFHRWRRDLGAHAARVRRAVSLALAQAAARHTSGGAFGHAAGVEGQGNGVGCSMSTDATLRGSKPMKVGLMVPANNTTMEVELAAWLPAGS